MKPGRDYAAGFHPLSGRDVRYGLDMIGLRGSGSTQVLIVGVAHLSAAVPDAAIARGRDLLRAWRPDLIGIENLPGHLVLEYEQRGGAFADFPVGGAPDARAGAAAVAGERPWDVWQARRVATDPQSSLTDRVLGWLLAREPDNALLLPWREADLPEAAHTLLTRLEASPSERVRIGVAIAKEFGHRELIHFDDHAGVGLLDQLPPNWTELEEPYQRQIKAELKGLNGKATDHDHWEKWVGATTPEFADLLERTESADRVDLPGSVRRAPGPAGPVADQEPGHGGAAARGDRTDPRRPAARDRRQLACPATARRTVSGSARPGPGRPRLRGKSSAGPMSFRSGPGLIQRNHLKATG